MYSLHTGRLWNKTQRRRPSTQKEKKRRVDTCMLKEKIKIRAVSVYCACGTVTEDAWTVVFGMHQEAVWFASNSNKSINGLHCQRKTWTCFSLFDSRLKPEMLQLFIATNRQVWCAPRCGFQATVIKVPIVSAASKEPEHALRFHSRG